MRIERINHGSPDTAKTVNGFLQTLVGKDVGFTRAQLETVMADANTNLFFAYDEAGTVVGMITVVVYEVITGKKAWAEDFVVDDRVQGKGIGRIMMEHAIQFAKAQKASALMLTSRPSRLAANGLYRKMGFEQKNTNVYQMNLSE